VSRLAYERSSANRPFLANNQAHTALMRCVRLNPTALVALIAGTALVALVSCADDRGPPQDTTVVFDGQTYTIHAPVSCGIAHDGKLVINTADGRAKLIRVVLARDYPLVVQSVGFRHLDVRGFTNHSNDVWATKGDDTYTISGRMPPAEGETAWHLFKIEVTCATIAEYTSEFRPPPNTPRPPRL
jgi:Mycobacterium 19 kDa lipoprotein antigen